MLGRVSIANRLLTDFCGRALEVRAQEVGRFLLQAGEDAGIDVQRDAHSGMAQALGNDLRMDPGAKNLIRILLIDRKRPPRQPYGIRPEGGRALFTYLRLSLVPFLPKVSHHRSLVSR